MQDETKTTKLTSAEATEKAFTLLSLQVQVNQLLARMDTLKAELKAYAENKGETFTFQGYGEVQVTRQTERQATGETRPKVELSKLDSLAASTRQALIKKGVLRFEKVFTGGAAPMVRVLPNK